jgi:hypothetical protein
MNKKKGIWIAVLLMLSIGNYTRLTGNENIRAIQFLSIFILGALSALLIVELITLYKAKQQLKKE